MKRVKRNIFYKLWLFMEVMRMRKLLLEREEYWDFLMPRYLEYLNELKSVI